MVRVLGVVFVIALLAALGLFGWNSGWFAQTAAVNPPASSAPTPPAAPGDPAEPAPDPGEPVGDGGAEQLPDEPVPPEPAAPVQPPEAPPAPAFDHHPAGALLPSSGAGYLDRTVWSPQMCFPFEDKAYANSQVYNPGGGMGPAGGAQCAASNYSLPWRDNFCESRGHSSPLCATGKGHQGQDIRPATCKKSVHWIVAAEDGIITDIGTYTVTLTGSTPPHRVYRYLHLRMTELAVAEGKAVKRGDRIGKASNDFGGTPTTIHMHFEMRAGVSGTSTDGKPVVVHTFLPPYLSLVSAYERKLAGQTCG